MLPTSFLSFPWPPRVTLFQANGTYELVGFRHGAPVYTKGKDDVSLSALRLDFSRFIYV